MNIKADHFAFAVRDMDQSIAFYQAVLDLPLKFVEENPEYGEKCAFLGLEGGNLELLSSLAGTPPPEAPSFLNCPHFAVEVPDLNTFIARLEELGVSFEGPNLIPENLTWLYFKDPDGNIIEACQWLK